MTNCWYFKTLSKGTLALKVLNSTYCNWHRLYFLLQIFHSQKHTLDGYAYFVECFISHSWCHGWTLHLLKICHTHWLVFKLHLNCITRHGVDLQIRNRKCHMTAQCRMEMQVALFAWFTFLFALQYKPTCSVSRVGYCGQLCSFRPKLPSIQAGLHCNANDKITLSLKRDFIGEY